MRTLIGNVLFAVRLIQRSPGFYALILILLAGGIGATTAMFSVVETALLKPLPYERAEDLTDVLRVTPQFPRAPSSLANFLDWRAQNKSFEQMAAVDNEGLSLSMAGQLPLHVDAAEVSGDFFSMLRLHALAGRLLSVDDDRPDAAPVAVMSASLWRERFGADPGMVGRTVTLDGRAFTLVGIAPTGFAFSSRNSDSSDMWIPLAVARPDYAGELAKERGSHYLAVMGRRRRGISLAEAQADMTAVAKNLEVAYPDTNAKEGVSLRDLHDALVGRSSRSIWLLFVSIGLVFVVVSANVANLLLARAQNRRGEMATRAALGATPRALATQIVTETVCVFGLASLLGAAGAAWLTPTLAHDLLQGAMRAAVVVRLDLPVLLASIGLSFLFGLAAGLGPALVTAHVAPESVLKQTSSRAGAARSHAVIRAVLVVTQVAVAFALLAGSGIAIKAFVKLAGTPPGFDAENLAVARVSLPERKYETDEKVRAFFRDATAQVAALPGVEAVTGNGWLPMSGSDSSGNFSIEGKPAWPRGDEPDLTRNFVLPGYFSTLRIPVLRGRPLAQEDGEKTRPVVVISKLTADRFFPGEDPIGKRIAWGTPSDGPSFTWREIVGVVGDVRRDGLDDLPVAEAYVPFAQVANNSMFLVIRAAAPDQALQALPRIVSGLDPEQAVADMTTLSREVAGTIGDSRREAVLLGSFALTALVLATLGLFGLVSYGTAERTREFGIRLALGSSPQAILRLVVAGGMKLVLMGLGIGLVLSFWVARAVETLVPGATAFDPTVLLPVPLVLGLAGLVACLLPAMRAVRTPPASALRYE
jgi:putative ABC transport system permease protein